MMGERRGAVARGLCWGLVAVVLAATAFAVGCQKSEEASDYIPLLASPKDETQRRAIEELIRMQQKAVPAVEQALHSETPLIRIGALKVLAKIRRMESVTLSGQMIDDKDLDVQHQAIASLNELAQVWKEKSVELLAHGLDMQDPVTVRSAAAALAGMTYDPATKVLHDVFESGQGIKSVYAAQQLYQMEPGDDTAQLLLKDLGSLDKSMHAADEEAIVGVRDATGAITTAGLQDKFVGPLVRYIDAQKDTGAASAAGAAQTVLNEVRDALISELEKTLDTKRAAVILEALGAIADKVSVDKLVLDVNDTRLESSWRVAADNALGIAGLSSRVQPDIKANIIKQLTAVLDDTDVDSRVRIGASISLCKLHQQNGVTFLLDELGGFEDAMAAASMTEARRQDLTALRVRAQEALTQAGDYVVPFLMDKMKLEAKLRPMTPEQQQAELKQSGEAKPGNITVWAAAKTMGELKVQDAIPYLGSYVTELRKSPAITVDDRGRMLADGKPADLALSDLEKPPEAEVTADQEKLEIFAYPDYVRLTAAIALGNIGGEQGRQLLQKAEQEESDFLASLEATKKAADYYKRAPVIEGLIHKHQDVLFYVRLAQQPAGQK